MKAKSKQDIQFEALYAKAWAAGVEAAEAKTPVPMIVGEPVDIFGNQIDFTKQVFHVGGGVCGFAWIKVRPANSPFGRWLKKTKRVRGVAYTGGYDLSIGAYGQSMEKKMAHAGAMARVLNEAGINCYADSRMD